MACLHTFFGGIFKIKGFIGRNGPQFNILGVWVVLESVMLGFFYQALLTKKAWKLRQHPLNYCYQKCSSIQDHFPMRI